MVTCMTIGTLERWSRKDKKMNNSKYVYPHPYEYARTLGQDAIEAWKLSHNRNTQCKDELTTCINQNYNGRALDTSFLTNLIEKYGQERTALVLAHSVNYYKNDGRIHNQNKFWSVNISDTLNLNCLLDNRLDYQINADTGLINIVINKFRQLYPALEFCAENVESEWER